MPQGKQPLPCKNYSYRSEFEMRYERLWNAKHMCFLKYFSKIHATILFFVRRNEAQMPQKRPNMRSRWALEATLGTTLAPRKINAIARSSPGSVLASFWARFWIPKSINLGIDSMVIFVMCCLLLLVRLGVDFGTLLVSKE